MTEMSDLSSRNTKYRGEAHLSLQRKLAGKLTRRTAHFMAVISSRSTPTHHQFGRAQSNSTVNQILGWRFDCRRLAARASDLAHRIKIFNWFPAGDVTRMPYFVKI